jgi:hypothetical protein
VKEERVFVFQEAYARRMNNDLISYQKYEAKRVMHRCVVQIRALIIFGPIGEKTHQRINYFSCLMGLYIIEFYYIK